MSDKNNPHITGRYAIIVAFIGLIGTFGAVYLSHLLEESRDKEEHETSEIFPKKEVIKPVKEIELDEANSGTFKDERDGQSYTWVRLKDGKKWMSQNLNYQMSGSWCYDNENGNCTKYGRLYTWYAAMLACPNDWRLPMDDDWWKMTIYYGKVSNVYVEQNINKEDTAGNLAYLNLTEVGRGEFTALLGGGRRSDGYFYSLNYYGIYWSSSEASSSNVWSYSFDNHDKVLYRYNNGKSLGFSCRCLQD